MSIFGLPMILFSGSVEVADVGDLEFIQGKVIAGDYFQVSGDINAINDTIEFIVPSAKTAFMIEAKVIPTGNNTFPGFPGGFTITNSSNEVEADLKIDSVVKDKVHVGSVTATSKIQNGGSGQGTGSGGYGNKNKDSFNVLGLSLVGDGIKVIEIENTVDNGSAFATMSGYVIDT